MVTVQAKLIFESYEDRQKVLELMRRWSSCMRFAYKRLLEGFDRNSLKKDLQRIFNLNSRYVDDAIMKAKGVLESCKQRGEDPRKAIFGGRELFEKLKKRHINGKPYKKLKIEWQEKRKGNLYSRGDRSKKGNLNTRIVVNERGTFLRINIGDRKYVFARLSAGFKKDKNRKEILQEIAILEVPYSVELKLKNGKIYAYFSVEELFPVTEITRENGAIGIDTNAYPNHMAWVEVDRNGQFISHGKIPMPELESGKSNKREYYRWQYAHEIVKIAKEKRKAIVIERLDIKDKGRRGDFSFRKSRRIRHFFSYRSLLDKVKILAKREGIEVIEVNPAYTSVIGMLKFAPQFMISKDVASAYVIARRGLGKKERIPANYMKLLNSLDVSSLEELKEYVSKEVKNIHLRRKQIKEIEYVMRKIQSPGSESGRLFAPLDGTSAGSCSEGYNLWRVLRVAVVTPLSPDRVLRDMSVLKSVLVSGQVGGPKIGASSYFLG
ncbi:IS200/IS605 family accessory protein TnpB-related protein [Caldicellulosiruptor morganii]|uniref:IS200/IS605 family accessory protein TnpB-related protein n=1 Tax=Caldicellulosiruptor morganii TaxID=1387555 RepID=A0ABY7BS12_9FIRM|nr:IS200/IS605 family accessory protein TnpB-related protein [Caldicellulosiruptor morganii]WAM34344.1 IS200/IS605 family accessory protein TnpB-related protein [Caldicellulosiruptor morganii]